MGMDKFLPGWSLASRQKLVQIRDQPRVAFSETLSLIISPLVVDQTARVLPPLDCPLQTAGPTMSGSDE